MQCVLLTEVLSRDWWVTLRGCWSSAAEEKERERERERKTALDTDILAVFDRKINISNQQKPIHVTVIGYYNIQHLSG